MIIRKKSLQLSFPEQQDYWNRIATKKTFNFPFYLDLFKQYSKKSYKVLDYGCGYGRILGYLVNAGFMHLYGIDFSDEMLKLTYKNYPTVNLSKNDSLFIPYDDNQFDTVIVCAVLGCNPNAQDQKLIIDEISRVLKPRGVLYLADFLITNDKRNIIRYKNFPTSINFEYGVFELKNGVLIRHHAEIYIKKLLMMYEEKVFLKSVVKTMNGHQANGFTYIGINRK
jgi:ubiquinone/menaquinone biosynthesis C-methylase UbiE